MIDDWAMKEWEQRREVDRKGIEYGVNWMGKLGSDGGDCYEGLQISDDEKMIQRK